MINKTLINQICSALDEWYDKIVDDHTMTFEEKLEAMDEVNAFHHTRYEDLRDIGEDTKMRRKR